ncbi:helix-turn-helix domain-containing protein [Salimicrobium sp. PL1-032A]|uniref:PucR family transcriptional regulator n=1 Tax=Salimicrobium sp. PL1-032A TaxID=3095364 RepID=UPI0032616EF4
MDHTKEIPDSPEGLADYIADELGCPVTIEDVNHRIISYSKHETKVDDARTATIMRRKVPERVVNGLWKEGVMGELFEKSSPILIPPIPDIGLGNRIAISVWKNKEVLGFIWAQTDEMKVTREQLETLKQASQVAARYLLKQRDQKRKNEEDVQVFLWQLFNGTITSQKEIEKRARQVELSLNDDVCVVIFEFMEAIPPTVKRHASYLTETLHQRNIAGRIFDDNHLYLLVRIKEETEMDTVPRMLIEDFNKKLQERSGFGEIRAGYGKLCHTPKELHISYQQAWKVLEMKIQHPEALQDTYDFQNLGVYQFLDEIARLYERDGFQNKTIEALRAYDHVNKTYLLETLRTFLSHNSNSQRTALHLHVHTNTLLYRLKRIRDITGVDLNNANEKTKLFIDLLLEV